MRILVGLVVLMSGCSRCSSSSSSTQPVAEPIDAAVTVDAAIAKPAPAQTPSMFSLVVRGPTGRLGNDENDIAQALPLMQRVGDGGLAVMSEYGRAVATGPGGLTVDVSYKDPWQVYLRGGDVQGQELLRWLWTDGTTSYGTYEEATMRSGPSIRAFSVGPKGYGKLHGEGYWDAVERDGSVLALERVTHEVQGAYIGSTATALGRARVGVLSGKAAAPIIPAGLCPQTMAAGRDGTLLVVVEKCTSDGTLGLLRYAPQKTTATPEWVKVGAEDPADPQPIESAVASANEMYVGYADTLETWDGKAWTAQKPFDRDHIISLSAGTDGAVWAIARDGSEGGYVTMKKPGATKWEDVALPDPPTTPLDDEAWRAPDTNNAYFQKVESAKTVDRTDARWRPRKIDAAGPEILVLATIDNEAFVFSTKPRTPVARIPSIDAQRAQLAKGFKRETTTLAKAGRACFQSFLMFPEGTKPETLGLGAPVDGGPELYAAQGIVENKPELIVYSRGSFGGGADIDLAAKRFAPLAPTRVCGPPVVDKDL